MRNNSHSLDCDKTGAGCLSTRFQSSRNYNKRVSADVSINLVCINIDNGSNGHKKNPSEPLECLLLSRHHCQEQLNPLRGESMSNSAIQQEKCPKCLKMSQNYYQTVLKTFSQNQTQIHVDNKFICCSLPLVSVLHSSVSCNRQQVCVNKNKLKVCILSG